jgi:hypothetical protein
MATKLVRRVFTDENGNKHYTTHRAAADYKLRVGTQKDRFGKEFTEQEYNPSAGGQIARGVAPSLAGTALAGMSGQQGAGLTQGVGAVANAGANVVANRLQAYHPDSKMAAMGAAGLSTGASAMSKAANQEMMRTGSAGRAALSGLAAGATGLVGGAVSSIPGAKSLARGFNPMIGGFMSGGLMGGLRGFAQGVMTSPTLGQDMANLFQRSKASDYNEGTWGKDMSSIESENAQDIKSAEEKVRQAAHNNAMANGIDDEDQIKAAGDAAVAAHRQKIAAKQAGQQPAAPGGAAPAAPGGAAPADAGAAPAPDLPKIDEPKVPAASAEPDEDDEDVGEPEPSRLDFSSDIGIVAKSPDVAPTAVKAANTTISAYNHPSTFADIPAARVPGAAPAAAPGAGEPPAAEPPVDAGGVRPPAAAPAPPPVAGVVADPARALAPAPVAAPPVLPIGPPMARPAPAPGAGEPPAPAPPADAGDRGFVANPDDEAPAPAPAPAPEEKAEAQKRRMEALDRRYSSPEFDPENLSSDEMDDYAKWLDDKTTEAVNLKDESLGTKIKQHAQYLGIPEEYARYALPEEEYFNHPQLKGRFRRVIPADAEERTARLKEYDDATAAQFRPDAALHPMPEREGAEKNLNELPIQEGRSATLRDISKAYKINGVPYYRTRFGLVRGYDPKIKGANASKTYLQHLFHLEGALQNGDMADAKRQYDALHREDRGIQLTSTERVIRHHATLTSILNAIDKNGGDENVSSAELDRLKEHAKTEYESIPQELRGASPDATKKTLENLYKHINERHAAAQDLRKTAAFRPPSTATKIGNIASAMLLPSMFYDRGTKVEA